MTIPDYKRQAFIDAFGQEKVEQMENEVSKRSTEAKEAEVESKEEDVQPEAVEEDTPPVSRQTELIEAFAPILDALNELKADNSELKERLSAIEKSEDERLTQKASHLPEASLADIVKSQLFSNNQAKESQPGPKEKEPEDSLFFESWMN